jgi:hypothetical protein
MALPGRTVPATLGAIGFDMNTPLNSARAKLFANQGYKFCIRYVSRNDETRANHAKDGTADLSRDEAAAILEAGMALMVIQHPPTTGWKPTPELGKVYGQNAAIYAADADLTAGVNVWLDLEGVASGTPTADIVGYCNAWFAAVEAAGYASGIYVGAQAYLTSEELFLDLKTKHYWKAGGDIPPVAHRGYQLIQHIRNAGTKSEFDQDVAQNDAFGDAAIWLAPG